MIFLAGGDSPQGRHTSRADCSHSTAPGFMSHEDFAHALRSLDAPYLLDGTGTGGVLGTEFSATVQDGASVTIVRLHDRIVESMRDVDAFVRLLGSRSHTAVGSLGGLLGAGVTPAGGVFVVAARVGGETLAERLAREGSISSAALLHIANRSVSRLEEHCGADGCHGLVMPHTVVLGTTGDVVLRWGGLFAALRASGMSATDIARHLEFASYLAPELGRGDKESERSDVFSLGATLYEALTGRPPFGGRTTSTVMAAVLADDGQPREETRTGLLRLAILRAIERDPDDRWPNAARFREALEPIPVPVVVPAKKRPGCLGVAAAGIALVLWSVLR
jgi:hypothetical protein